MSIRKIFWLSSAVLPFTFSLFVLFSIILSLFPHLLDVFSLSKNNNSQLSNLSRLNQPSWVYSLAVSPNGKILAIGSYSGEVWLWNLENRKLPVRVLSAHTDAVESLAFSQDSQTLLSGGWDNHVKVWNLTEKLPTSVTLHGHIDDVQRT